MGIGIQVQKRLLWRKEIGLRKRLGQQKTGIITFLTYYLVTASSLAFAADSIEELPRIFAKSVLTLKSRFKVNLFKAHAAVVMFPKNYEVRASDCSPMRRQPLPFITGPGLGASQIEVIGFRSPYIVIKDRRSSNFDEQLSTKRKHTGYAVDRRITFDRK